MQPLYPVFGWYLPFSQSLHPVAPVLDWYCPAGQFLQSVSPLYGPYLPLGQACSMLRQKPPSERLPEQ